MRNRPGQGGGRGGRGRLDAKPGCRVGRRATRPAGRFWDARSWRPPLVGTNRLWKGIRRGLVLADRGVRLAAAAPLAFHSRLCPACFPLAPSLLVSRPTLACPSHVCCLFLILSSLSARCRARSPQTHRRRASTNRRCAPGTRYRLREAEMNPQNGDISRDLRRSLRDLRDISERYPSDFSSTERRR